MITGSMLYDLVNCPTRVYLDKFGTGARDEVSPFVQLLWKQGVQHEEVVLEQLGPVLNLSDFPADERLRLTTQAMDNGAPLIYGGRIVYADMIGDPDLLQREAAGYVAGDIKSGVGLEGQEDTSKLKKTYAVQLGLYTEILERVGRSGGRTPFIVDVNTDRISYSLDEAQGPRTPQSWWAFYEGIRDQARAIVANEETPLACAGAICKLCWWYSFCKEDVQVRGDLSLIPELGRSKRDILAPRIPTVEDLANANLAQFSQGKKSIFPGIGIDTLSKFQHRASLLADPAARPVLTSQVAFPEVAIELFFDIEVDPFRDCCYLHGFIERRARDNTTERFIPFFVDDPEGDQEKEMFSAALDYMRGFDNVAVYYYSKYERTIYRKLRMKYPDVISEVDLEAIFKPPLAIDLYFDVVKKATEWPTHDHSIKTLAKYLGFGWRDTNPSGAASIEWYDRFIQNSSPENKQRILDYNEDDCRATRILLDGIRAL